MEELIRIQKDDKGNEFVSARDLHKYLEATERFSNWFDRQLQYGFIEGEDYSGCKEFNTLANQYITNYRLTLDCAKEIAVIQRSKKGSEIRKFLLDVLKQRQNLETFNAKEAAFAFKVINAMKYVCNQIEAKNKHQKSYIEKLDHKDKYMYAEFNRYRSELIGYNKETIDKMMVMYCIENHQRMTPEKKKSSMSNKLSIIDTPEAIKVAVMDMLYSKGENPDTIDKFSNMVKSIAREMEVKAVKENDENMFRIKEKGININGLLE